MSTFDVIEMLDAVAVAQARQADEARLAELRRRVDEADAEAERLAKVADEAIAAEIAAWKRVQALRAELTHETVATLLPMQPRTQQ